MEPGRRPRSASATTGRGWRGPSGSASTPTSPSSFDPDSTLAFYRAALRRRRSLAATDTEVVWLDDDALLLRFRRSRNSWECVVKLLAHPQPLPPGRVLLTSSPLDSGQDRLPADAAAWLVDGGEGGG